MLCPAPEFQSRKNRLQLSCHPTRRSRSWAWGLLALLVLASIISTENSAAACKIVVSKKLHENNSGAQASVHRQVRNAQPSAPRIFDSGFVWASRHANDVDSGPTRLWLELNGVPEGARAALLEPVWGSGPDSFAEAWGRPIAILGDVIEVFPEGVGGHRDQPFTLGVRARFVMSDGTLSPPSLPVFISHTGASKHDDGVHADTVLLVLCCLILMGLWVAYRRETDAVYQIRIAAGAALLSLFFLSVAPALSWYVVEDPGSRLDAVECHLGDEAQCATYVPDAGPNPMSLSEVAAERRFELASWMGASSAFRLGLVWCLVLLLPALIWLMVVPTLRPAQTAVAFGASAAGYTFLSALFYRLCTPSWMSAEITHAFDLTLLSSGTIFVAIGIIIRLSLRLEIGERHALPSAVVQRL